jgi:hypothetical protein
MHSLLLVIGYVVAASFGKWLAETFVLENGWHDEQGPVTALYFIVLWPIGYAMTAFLAVFKLLRFIHSQYLKATGFDRFTDTYTWIFNQLWK